MKVLMRRLKKIEKVLCKENEILMKKGRKEKVEGMCIGLMSIPCCEIFDSCLKRLKLLVRVLLLVMCIAAGVLFSIEYPHFPLYLPFFRLCL
jgi:hypothetical protein